MYVLNGQRTVCLALNKSSKQSVHDEATERFTVTKRYRYINTRAPTNQLRLDNLKLMTMQADKHTHTPKHPYTLRTQREMIITAGAVANGIVLSAVVCSVRHHPHHRDVLAPLLHSPINNMRTPSENKQN